MANGVSSPSAAEAKGAGGYVPSEWSKVYHATVTATFDTNIAAAGEEEYTFTVTGAAFGDHVEVTPTGGDAEAHIFTYSGHVAAANSVGIVVANRSTSADHPSAVTGFKVAVRRPGW